MPSTTTQSTRGLFVALFIIAVGVVLLLDQQGIITADWNLLWPAAFIFFGLEHIICKRGMSVWGWILLVAGLLLLLSDLGLLHIRIGINAIWALLLIALGVMMLLRRSFGNDWIRIGWFERLRNRISDSSHASVSDSQFDQVFLFSGTKRRIAVPNFRGGRLLAIFGGFNIDLTKAEIEGESAQIHAEAIFGGGEIRVPETWAIDIQASAILGAFTDETHQFLSAGPVPPKRLIITGSAIFGGVVLKN